MADEEVIMIDEALLEDLYDESLEASEAHTEINVDQGLARIQFANEEGVLSSLTTDSAGLYDLAQQLLRAYDRLEGL